MNILVVPILLIGVSLTAYAQERPSKCPYNALYNSATLSWMNITHKDILFGTLIENKTYVDVFKMCESSKLSSTFDDISRLIDQCNSVDADPTLPVFNLEGFQDAIEYLCQDKNLAVLNKNMECFRRNVPAMEECRTERLKQAADTDGDDQVANACSQQRAHEYCSRTVLSRKCETPLSDLKIKMSQFVLSPNCDCDEIVERRGIGRCMSRFCMNIDGQDVGEKQMYEGLLFGATNVDNIQQTCRSTKDGMSYELEQQLARCADQSCQWRDHDYKFRIYNKDGLKKAAKYFCESQNFIYKAAECIKRQFTPFQQCLDQKFEEEEKFLSKEEKIDVMNDYMCRRRAVTSQCIDDHFYDCGGDILARLQEAWLLRAPRICRTDCEPIGFGGAATMTSSISIIVSTIITIIVMVGNGK